MYTIISRVSDGKECQMRHIPHVKFSASNLIAHMTSSKALYTVHLIFHKTMKNGGIFLE